MAPKTGNRKNWKPTEIEIQYGKKESGAMGMPKIRAMPSGKALPAATARLATNGPRNTVPIVVLNAEFAQSYIAQPKISFLLFTIASLPAVAIYPPVLLHTIHNPIKANKL
jgi:hypothetical protein